MQNLSKTEANFGDTGSTYPPKLYLNPPPPPGGDQLHWAWLLDVFHALYFVYPFCRVSNFNSLMQISPCLQNVTFLLKPHHHLCKIDRTMDKKVFPAKHFIEKNNSAFSSEKLSIFLCAWTHACNFCRHFTWLMATGWSKLEPLYEQNCKNHRNLDQTIS